MTIGLFTDTYRPDINGVATATEVLANVLAKQGNTVYVVTTNLPGHREIETEGNIIRIPGIVMKKVYFYRLAGIFSRKAYQILRQLPFDVVHVQSEAGIGYFGRIFARLMELPLVYTYHTLYADFTYMFAKNSRGLDATLKKIVSLYSHNWGEAPDEFITTSDKTRDALRRYGVKRYINVIPNGIDLTAIRPTAATDRAADAERTRLGLDGKRILLIVGRIGKEKGMDYVVRCLRHYLDGGGDRNTRLVIVGDGPYRRELEKIIKNAGLEGDVVLVGKVPHEEVAKYYRMADLLLSGSKSETQGLTINEAMACRCLVFVRHDYNFDSIITEGETGFFFRSQDTFSAGLAKIKALSPAEREHIKDRAAARNEKLYSVEEYGKEIMDVYRRAQRKCW